MPLSSAPLNARSRFGPCTPLVFARLSEWQEPHFWTNSAFPLTRSGSRSRPQPLATAASPVTATAASVLRRSLTGAEDYPAARPDVPSSSGRGQLVQATL